MKVAIKDLKGNPTGELEVKFELVANGRGTQAVHDEVVGFRAGERSGTAATKTMGEVNGTGKKPWRQKGTGRARAGSFASPLWRGGGVTHGPQPRDFSKKVNARVKQLALRKALTERLKAGDVVVVDDLKVSAPKTKEFVEIVQRLGLDGTALFIVGKDDRNVHLASRNVVGVGLTSGKNINTYQILQYDKLVFTKDGFAQIEQRLAK